MWGKLLWADLESRQGSGEACCESGIIAGLTVSAAGCCFNCNIISAATGHKLCLCVPGSVSLNSCAMNAVFIFSSSFFMKIRKV